MADSINIPETRESSFLNRHLLTGAKIGALPVLGAIAALTVTATPIAGIVAYALYGLGVASVVGGAVAGGYYGKERIDENLANGGERTIDPPRLFNEGMFQGLLNGALLTLGTLAAAAFFTPALAGVIGASAEALSPWVLGAAAGAGLMGTLGLSYVQGKNHEDQMGENYRQAQIIKAQLTRGGGLGLDKLLGLDSKAPAKAPATSHAITADDLALLQARMDERGPKRPHTQSLDERRQLELAMSGEATR